MRSVFFVDFKKKRKKINTYSRRFFTTIFRAATRDTLERARYLEVALEDLQRGEFRPAACALTTGAARVQMLAQQDAPSALLRARSRKSHDRLHFHENDSEFIDRENSKI